jgi:hypothetical protein
MKEEDLLSSTRFESSCLGVLVDFFSKPFVLTAAHCFEDYQMSSQPFQFKQGNQTFLLKQTLWASFRTDRGVQKQICSLRPKKIALEEDLSLYELVSCHVPKGWRMIQATQDYRGPWFTLKFGGYQTYHNGYQMAASRLVFASSRLFTVLSPIWSIPCPGDSGSGLYRLDKGLFYLIGILKGGKGCCHVNPTLFYANVWPFLSQNYRKASSNRVKISERT